jgi:hypothetical protein
MSIFGSLQLPLADEAPDPATVGPGLIAFFVFLGLAAAVVFLWFSLRKHLGKVHFDEEKKED